MINSERVLSKFKPHIIVATPGRFWELCRQGQSWLQSLELIKYLVIDEADRMAEKGHFAELGSIVQAIGQCQKFIFSATLTLTHKGIRFLIHIFRSSHKGGFEICFRAVFRRYLDFSTKSNGTHILEKQLRILKLSFISICSIKNHSRKYDFFENAQ